MRGLAGRRVLITGAGGGIGRATARRFAAEGARVALVDRDETALAASLAALDPNAAGPHQALGCDVARDDAVDRTLAAAVTAFGGIDILVNNAGFAPPDPSDTTDMAAFDAVMAVNLRGAIRFARAAIGHFLEAGTRGVVLNNTSVHDTIPKPGFLGYAVSKAALAAATRTLALEFAHAGIRVNAVGPGATVTAINASWTDDPVRRATVSSHIPLGRPAEADEIASAFAFLASDDASYVTGVTLHVDGGLMLHPEFRENWAT